jgi:hypothetical protein
MGRREVDFIRHINSINSKERSTPAPKFMSLSHIKYIHSIPSASESCSSPSQVQSQELYLSLIGMRLSVHPEVCCGDLGPTG